MLQPKRNPHAAGLSRLDRLSLPPHGDAAFPLNAQAAAGRHLRPGPPAHHQFDGYSPIGVCV
jgi:hypothetical protein